MREPGAEANGRTPMNRTVLLAFLTVALGLLPAATASARPERIRPGHSYYSDDQVVEGQVRDIAEEKNYEEVFQAYRYYEVVYDEAERVVLFKEYKRGDVVRTEEYHYGDGGDLASVVIREPGKPPETVAVDSGEAKSDDTATPP
jgi:hypothetical protein